MLRKRQFSIGYLMLEMFWIAAALGMFRALAYERDGNVVISLIIGGIVATGAAVGGMFGKMFAGAGWAFALFAVAAFVLPAVQ